MATSSPVRMTIVGIRNKCSNGHKLGEQYVVRNKTPGGICLGSFGAVLPYLTALRFGASFPWEDEKGVITIGCPDHENEVIWRLERIREDE
jgi:uncharacterized repeat protein (TIGR04076 family)